jgi:beta-phosphoglucomutase-like phosphatase (HAD superfamily)
LATSPPISLGSPESTWIERSRPLVHLLSLEGFSGANAFRKMSLQIGANPEDVVEAVEEAHAAEEEMVDKSVKILPGVRKMIDSLPEGKYAVATSRARTYGSFISFLESLSSPSLSIPLTSLTLAITLYFSLRRHNPSRNCPSQITDTADDKRLKRGKPFPGPFLLSAKELGFPCDTTVIFEDSPYVSLLSLLHPSSWRLTSLRSIPCLLWGFLQLRNQGCCRFGSYRHRRLHVSRSREDLRLWSPLQSVHLISPARRPTYNDARAHFPFLVLFLQKQLSTR